MTDNLPELPDFQPLWKNIMTVDGTKRVAVYNTLVDMLRSYAITARESERARADALEAALREIVDRLANNTLFAAESGHWQRARSLLEKTKGVQS